MGCCVVTFQNLKAFISAAAGSRSSYSCRSGHYRLAFTQMIILVAQKGSQEVHYQPSLTNPDVLKQLKAELAVAIPDPNRSPTCAQIENLPYLLAVIYETLRLYPAFVTRMQQVSPEKPLYYDSQIGNNTLWTIPAGICESMQVRMTQMNPIIFSEPEKYRPERWLENPRLDRYLLTFSRGN